MTVTIELHPEEQSKLAARAAAAGQDVASYVQGLIKRDIDSTLSITAAAEPIAKAVTNSGIADADFDIFVEQSRREIWEERRARSDNPR